MQRSCGDDSTRSRETGWASSPPLIQRVRSIYRALERPGHSSLLQGRRRGLGLACEPHSGPVRPSPRHQGGPLHLHLRSLQRLFCSARTIPTVACGLRGDDRRRGAAARQLPRLALQQSSGRARTRRPAPDGRLVRVREIGEATRMVMPWLGNPDHSDAGIASSTATC